MRARTVGTCLLLLLTSACTHSHVVARGAAPEAFEDANRIVAGKSAEVLARRGEVFRWQNVRFRPDSTLGIPVATGLRGVRPAIPTEQVATVTIGPLRWKGAWEGAQIGAVVGAVVGLIVRPVPVTFRVSASPREEKRQWLGPFGARSTAPSSQPSEEAVRGLSSGRTPVEHRGGAGVGKAGEFGESHAPRLP